MDTEQDLRFLQDRLALFGQTVFVISGFFLVLSVTLDFLESSIGWVAHASHFGATLLALILFRIGAMQRDLSPDALQMLDAFGTVAMCGLFALMGHYLPQPYGFYTALLAVVHVNISRAVILPSVPSRTLMLVAASFVGLISSRALTPLPAELAASTVSRVRWVLEAVAWSAAAGGVAVMTSRVIYGLQERALEARQLGQYSLEEKIGEGGMGEIYRARHAMLRRPTAVKLLTGDGSEEQLRRFEKEVQLTARLTHPNTISIFDYGRTPDGTFYYAMELLSGLTLEELVKRYGPQPPGRVIHLMLQVCGALSEAHGIGLIHRDIKPANIYLCRRGGVADVVKVLDFGLVREVRDDGNVTRSNINVIVGTPLFLSPEAILSPDKIDARADIYGLGGVLYLLLTGSTPFGGRSVVEICGHQLHSQPEPLAARVPYPISEDLERLVLACLAKDPADRPQSARALANALAECRDAGTWSELDADAWWCKVPEGAAEAPLDPPVRRSELPRPPRRTFCCADMAKRLGGPPPRENH
jgi:serine/threonine-protein kinase